MKIFLIVAAMIAAGPALAQTQLSPDAMLASSDANGDSVITRAEFRQARLQRFEKADRNRDGAVSRDDFKRLARFRPDVVKRLNNLIAEADANGDGRVTRDEISKAPTPIFDRADANRDGKIDQRELAAFKAKAAALKQR